VSRRPIDDNHFRQFAGVLERAIARWGDTSEEDLVTRQKRQIENLVSLEKEFRRTLIKHQWGPGVYKAFIKHICEEKRNILAARPYFRERQEVFSKSISKALKKKADKGLYKFHFNVQFVLFALSVYRWHPNSQVVKLAKQILAARQELVEMNLPLAISRARIFWSRTPESQLSYMDLVQITSEGLMSGIDKFVLPYSQAFRHMVIGRMIGNLIEQYSETLLHFYPLDKKKLYRVNKLLSKAGENPDFELIAEEVNRDLEPGHRTTAEEISMLVAAASTVSADVPASNEVDGEESLESTPIHCFQANEAMNPDVQVERAEALAVISKSLVELPMIERKLLRLKGVTL
jgi:DNA-directed RNA polymerase specialized sigma subunit